jgi:4-amino-4-deoxychorismate lyase
MVRFIESIRCHNGKLDNISYHQERINRTFASFFPSSLIDLQLDKLIIPKTVKHGCFKCRMIYSNKLEDIQFLPYQIKPIRSLRLVKGGDYQYDYKFADRKEINHLFSQRGDADDILIVKHGSITDTSYANIAFYDGQNWFTPFPPLLEGTRRQSLLDLGIIRPKDIRVNQLEQYSHLRLFNAMIPFEEGITLPVSSIQNFAF